jgi:hypothetical protein
MANEIGVDTDAVRRAADGYDDPAKTLYQVVNAFQAIQDLVSQGAIANDSSGKQFAANYNPQASQLALAVAASRTGVMAIQQSLRLMASNFEAVEEEAKNSISTPDMFGPDGTLDDPSSATPEPPSAEPRPVTTEP